MLYDIPRLRPGLTMTPTLDPDTGRLAYALSLPGAPGGLRLDPAPVMLILLLDGATTVQGACKRAEAFGLAPPPQVVTQLVSALYQAGFATTVPMADVPQRALPGTEHVCEGCGRSCEGHLVGPLPVPEAQRVADLFDALAEKVPRLKGRQPLARHAGRDGIFLPLTEGRCLYLDPDRRCAIHRHFGAEAKPSICRMFPYTRIYAEDGTRVGVSSACYRHHAHMQRSLGDPGDPIQLDGELAALPQVTDTIAPFLPPPLTRATPEVAAARKQVEELELRLLTELGEPDCTIARFIASLLDAPPLTADKLLPTVQVPAAVVTRARAALAQLHDEFEVEGSFMGFMMKQDDPEGMAGAYQRFGEALEAVATQRALPARALPWPPNLEPFVLDSARRMVWLREMMRFSDPFEATAVLLLGALLGLLSAPDEGDVEGVFEHTIETFTTWYRVVTVEGGGEQVFSGQGEAIAFLQGWLT